MNRTTRISLLAVGTVLAALLTAVLAFMLGNMVMPAFMNHIEVNGQVIPMTGTQLNYQFDMPLNKGEPIKGVLVMQDGTEYDINYSSDYDMFTIDDKFGMYTFN